jgi:hypothetical protein
MADRASQRDSTAAQSTGNKENVDFFFITPPTLWFSQNLSSPNQSARINRSHLDMSANILQRKESSPQPSQNPTANTPRIAKPPKPRILAKLFRPKKISQASEIGLPGLEPETSGC